MFYKKLKQTGFGAIELIIILALACLVGFTGWFIYSKNRSTENLQIPELGIQLKNVPSSLKGLTYEIEKPSGNDTYLMAPISTFDLSKHIPKCYIGELDTYEGKYNDPSELRGIVTFVKQFDKFWVGYFGLLEPCGKANSAEFKMQKDQIQSFKSYLKDEKNIQDLR